MLQSSDLDDCCLILICKALQAASHTVDLDACLEAYHRAASGAYAPGVSASEGRSALQGLTAAQAAACLLARTEVCQLFHVESKSSYPNETKVGLCLSTLRRPPPHAFAD